MPNQKETDKTVIDSRDLLYRYLEFQSLTPNNNTIGTRPRLTVTRLA